MLQWASDDARIIEAERTLSSTSDEVHGVGQRGGFVGDAVFQFDAPLFNVAPREADQVRRTRSRIYFHDLHQ